MKLLIRSIIIVIIIGLLFLFFVSLAGCKSISKELKTSTMITHHIPIEALINTIEKEMDEKKITGLSVVVSNSDGVLWSEGFGLANKKTKEAFTETTISNIGSVSKLITLTAIMRLVEEGMVELDEPVATYIPEFKPLGIEDYSTP